MLTPELYFIAGVPRSGSTFSFNIVRELLESRGVVAQRPDISFDGVLADNPRADFAIIKAHDATRSTLDRIQAGEVKVICTVRKPEDAIASWMEAFGFGLDQSIDMIMSWLRLFEKIHDHALIVDYEEIDRRYIQAALKIARYAVPDFDPAALGTITARNFKATIWSRTQFMNPDHPSLVKHRFQPL